MIGGYLLSLITMGFFLSFFFNISELEAPPVAVFLIYFSESKNRVLDCAGNSKSKDHMFRLFQKPIVFHERLRYCSGLFERCFVFSATKRASCDVLYISEAVL
jgi:hypothetical protein